LIFDDTGSSQHMCKIVVESKRHHDAIGLIYAVR